jgi:hypothetical protein
LELWRAWINCWRNLDASTTILGPTINNLLPQCLSVYCATSTAFDISDCSRLTRLINAFSKKFENFVAAISLNFAYYNFRKVHGAIRCTPAMVAGIEKSQWTVAELVERCGE